MRIYANHKGRQFDDTDTTSLAPGLRPDGTTIMAGAGTGPFTFDPLATASVTGGVPIADKEITITDSPTQTPTPSATPTNAAVSSGVSKNQLPLGLVIGVCVGTFIGVVLLVCLFYAWYKRSSDKMSAAGRRNAAGQAEQHRARTRSFNRLTDSEKGQSDVPPPLDVPAPTPTAREQQESDEKNFAMFKKSPSVRTAYTTKTTTEEENAYDLPQLEFTKYHPSLAQELSLEHPEKPFATAVRQNSGISWDGETVGDDSFLSMRSVRVESGTMSPTMVMAKMTPPATASALHKWESAEVLNMEDPSEPAGPVPRNPFTDMAEERRARPNNPFFNAQDANRQSRAIRSRSNSRTSRASRAQSLVRGESRSTQPTAMPNVNPFLDHHDAAYTSAAEASASHSLPPNAALPNQPSIPRDSSASTFGNERAMASLIAALDLTKEQVEQRLRVVSMQGSTFSAYSEDDALTVREFPLPPGTTAPRTP